MAGLTREQRAEKAARLAAEVPPADAPQTSAVPRVSVINRRLQNPFGTPSREIPLRGDKSSGWVVRTFSSDPEHPNRHYDAVHRMGWVPLTKMDLAVSAESLGFTIATDGRIVRGPHGHEVLMAMPHAEFVAIQEAKSRENLRKLGAAYTKQEVAQATAKATDPQGGDVVASHFTQTEIIGPVSG